MHPFNAQITMTWLASLSGVNVHIRHMDGWKQVQFYIRDLCFYLFYRLGFQVIFI